MNAWLWAATALVVAVIPLVGVAATRPALEGLVALEAAGTLTTTCLLLLAEGTDREAFADLAVAAGALSFCSAVAFLRFLDRAT